ncbi:MAG: hypothetical protein LRZ87_01290 [Methanocellales archaeon]|nr:hypothetical protein [Methanocellales archaeon]
MYGTVENVNNYDEDVQIICEGGRENIDAFLVELETLKKDREGSTMILTFFVEQTKRFHEGAQQLMAMRRENIGFKNLVALNKNIQQSNENIAKLVKTLIKIFQK